MTMPLSKLFTQASRDPSIRELTLDSRNVRPGDLFLAVPGTRMDGREHIADALKRGAAAVAYEAEGATVLPITEVPLIPVKGLAAQLSDIAGRFYGEPSRLLDLVGVTGTNGKTSVTQLVAQALDLLGQHCGLIGTLGTGFYGALQSGRLTTPDPIAVQATLNDLKKAGAKAVAMEVSSHALDQGRVAALAFDIAVMTNLSRDHLDYHGSMQAYEDAKTRLFGWPNLRCRVVNLDDDFGRRLAAEQGESRLISYSLKDPAASLYCREAHFDDDGVRAVIVTAQGEHSLRSRLLGRFNLSNMLAAVGTLMALDYPLDEILKVTPVLEGPVGRMQRLGGGSKPLVVVDYAHTPDALEQVLQALRPHAKGQLLCLFGCGGDRDRGKRPLMAEVAERLADGVLVTDDNPRTEDPQQIFADIRPGFAQADAVEFVAGRGPAIAQLIASAGVDDVIVLAGKGHEDYQEINGERHDFSDLVEAEKALAVWEAPDA
ncbi:UDP-N-acetylmuramoyl-L-alanyl-D-glutamate--2,6-diaminopimelate ligase [Pseudomonas wadenswilerensis]|jgi:UDP-N-acetylmuramoyl-L-alanyl-D-glutamate--2,6-diaminopimelate ligase|uniref:UDP-N-acetylmuramoyl-L-alanyl-D-glutamate--2,6-diaminopimelate ligase n=1 Tax=Pseudomonas wadenswilerensis TaxID=1785161 RepID=A0A380SVC2_9PSED|nr:MULTISPECIES: UDP-N-acetylmuramoyl-L-alanyl-D-glutamate--2,6-diaminopimelate ligase [Pseudomonas]MCE5983402.1 UDP-N-acetylmuramoyl-L-alanyl-D-glutamate--2,6-diaminopimelate ligase [Pseudomonas sp. LF19]SPO65193.1 UDP-N-acetylmuramoyl-L-alanyl-D-glutamate:meso-diaminopimelate ligase [Pseudomonas sp. JV241A]SUQ61695.1 UDP-N-acetylmuramoyl-L-alanyl-D-glutamate-2, 6-diaminopimelate ligase [Pseudomonas wadenswilerensis]